MRTLSLILVFLSALRLSSADVPRSIHKTCASKVMKKCKCKDWKCIDQAMQNSCAVPKSTERRRRYMRLVRSHVRHAYCDPTPLPTAISGMCLVHESTFGCGKRVFDQSCESVIDSYEWLSGNCCSLKDHGDGSCMLTVDGPGSFCELKVKDEENYFTYMMSNQNKGVCPRSQYKVPVQDTSKTRDLVLAEKNVHMP
jgi:hypothetical protein